MVVFGYSQRTALLPKVNKTAITANLGGIYQLGGGVQVERIILGGQFIHLPLGAGLGQFLGLEQSPIETGTIPD